MATTNVLFNPYWNNAASGLNGPETHLAQMMGLLGPFPMTLMQTGRLAKRWFDTSSGMICRSIPVAIFKSPQALCLKTQQRTIQH